jgi:hypothetical protein
MEVNKMSAQGGGVGSLPGSERGISVDPTVMKSHNPIT